LTEARIASLLRNGDGAIKARAKNVYASVSDGVVMLYGATRDFAAARDIEEAIRVHTGAEAVQNSIRITGPYLNA
jgi:osmotically-inducible protein OsmY